ncbi:MAG: zinc-ribbon domain-containing protein [Ruminococcaceae bacterium]|nr:zinc-ribbon domain-containing protein [Oscillospiraceae bacterium]
MKKCKYCGAELLDEAVFCSQCGMVCEAIEEENHFLPTDNEPETSVLAEDGLETSVLQEDELETSILEANEPETSILEEDELETSILDNESKSVHSDEPNNVFVNKPDGTKVSTTCFVSDANLQANKKTERIMIVPSVPAIDQEIEQIILSVGLEPVYPGETDMENLEREILPSFHSLKENTLERAHICCSFTKVPVVAAETAIQMLRYSDSKWGTRTWIQRYFSEINILDELYDKPKSARKASLLSCIVVVAPTGKEWVFEESCNGYISRNELQNCEIGYDRVFKVGKKYMAQIPQKKKNELTNRDCLFRELKKVLIGLSGC